MPLHIEENPFASAPAAKESPTEVKLDPETVSQAASNVEPETAAPQPEKRSWFKRAPKKTRSSLRKRSFAVRNGFMRAADLSAH
ncbi:MAG: hypothetical protein ACLRRK_07670 [Parasutterella sp.]